MSNNVLSDLSKKDKIDFYISLIVLILSGAFILYYSFPSFFTSDSTQSIVYSNPQEVEEVDIDGAKYIPLEIERTKNEYQKPVQEIRQIPLAKRIDSVAQNKIELDSDTTENNVRIVSDSIANQLAEIQNEIADSVDGVLYTDVDSLIGDTDVLKTKVEQNISEYSKSTTNVTSLENKDIPQSKSIVDENVSKECIILIGLFGNAKNVEKLKSKLKKEGYSVFFSPYKGMTRIGVYQPCDLSILEQELTKMRKGYAKDAIILKAK